MAEDQKSKSPENITDPENLENLGSPDVLDNDSGQGSTVPADQGDNISKAGTVPRVDGGTVPDASTSDDEDPRVDISSGEDVDVEPDEEEQSDEPAPPIIPPERIE